MSDIGTKTSLKGYDVISCADHELLFSSSWPLLKIEKQGSFEITDKTQDVTITTHDLGYPPMFLAYASYGVNATDDQTRLLTTPVMVSDTTLKWFGDYYSEGAGAITVYYYIFRYNMTENFTSPVVNTESSTPATTSNYGFKIAKDGASTESSDLRDYVVHSGARSLQIHKTWYENKESEGWLQSITHGLPYEPFFLFYLKNTYTGYATTGYWKLMDARSQEVGASADTSTVNLVSIPKGEAFVAIFKDPFSLEQS